MPIVTVLLTSYNHGDYIRGSIESILNQTFKDFELYIIDDCSSDNSWDIIQEYKDDRIIAIRHEKNEGGCTTRALYSGFKGKYFAMAHCDDMWELDKLEKQVNYLESHPEAAACFTNVQLIDDDGNNFNQENHPYSHVFLNENMTRFEWLNHFFYHGNRLCHPSSLIRMDVQMKDDLFAAGLGALPDYYRWVKLCLKHEIYVHPDKLTKFRIHTDESNTSGQTPVNRIRVQNEFYQIAKLYASIKNKDEFLKVFPEANEYVVDGKINVDYALAQIMLNNTTFKAFHFCALNTLMELVRNEDTKDELIELYGFTKRDVCRLTGKYDVLHVIPDEEYLNTSLYYTDAEEFSETSRKNLVVPIINDHFKVTYNLDGAKVAMLRLDPTEAKYIKLKNIKISIDQEENHSNDIAHYHEQEGEWTYIYSLDPFLLVRFDDLKEIKQVVVEADVQCIEPVKLLDYENKVSILRTKNVDNFSNKQLLRIIYRRSENNN